MCGRDLFVSKLRISFCRKPYSAVEKENGVNKGVWAGAFFLNTKPKEGYQEAVDITKETFEQRSDSEILNKVDKRVLQLPPGCHIRTKRKG